LLETQKLQQIIGSQYHIVKPMPQEAILANRGARIDQHISYSGASSNIPALDKIPD
jgi:hypothetical protein